MELYIKNIGSIFESPYHDAKMTFYSKMEAYKGLYLSMNITVETIDAIIDQMATDFFDDPKSPLGKGLYTSILMPQLRKVSQASTKFVKYKGSKLKKRGY